MYATSANVNDYACSNNGIQLNQWTTASQVVPIQQNDDLWINTSAAAQHHFGFNKYSGTVPTVPVQHYQHVSPQFSEHQPHQSNQHNINHHHQQQQQQQLHYQQAYAAFGSGSLPSSYANTNYASQASLAPFANISRDVESAKQQSDYYNNQQNQYPAHHRQQPEASSCSILPAMPQQFTVSRAHFDDNAPPSSDSSARYAAELSTDTSLKRRSGVNRTVQSYSSSNNINGNCQYNGDESNSFDSSKENINTNTNNMTASNDDNNNNNNSSSLDGKRAVVSAAATVDQSGTIAPSVNVAYPTFFTTQKIVKNTAKLSYTPYQLELLNLIYDQHEYPNSVQKTLIAKVIGISRDQVKIWFQNRRRKGVLAKNGKYPDCVVGTTSSGMSSAAKSQGVKRRAASDNDNDCDSNSADETSVGSPEQSSAESTQRKLVEQKVSDNVLFQLRSYKNAPSRLSTKRSKLSLEDESNDELAFIGGVSAHQQSSTVPPPQPMATMTLAGNSYQQQHQQQAESTVHNASAVARSLDLISVQTSSTSPSSSSSSSSSSSLSSSTLNNKNNEYNFSSNTVSSSGNSSMPSSLLIVSSSSSSSLLSSTNGSSTPSTSSSCGTSSVSSSSSSSISSSSSGSEAEEQQQPQQPTPLASMPVMPKFQVLQQPLSMQDYVDSRCFPSMSTTTTPRMPRIHNQYSHSVSAVSVPPLAAQQPVAYLQPPAQVVAGAQTRTNSATAWSPLINYSSALSFGPASLHAAVDAATVTAATTTAPLAINTKDHLSDYRIALPTGNVAYSTSASATLPVHSPPAAAYEMMHSQGHSMATTIAGYSNTQQMSNVAPAQQHMQFYPQQYSQYNSAHNYHYDQSSNSGSSAFNYCL